MIRLSAKFNDAAFTSIRICPGSGVGSGVPVAAGQIGDGFVAQRQGQRDAPLFQLRPAEIAKQVRSRPEVVGLRVRHGRSFCEQIGRMRAAAAEQ